MSGEHRDQDLAPEEIRCFARELEQARHRRGAGRLAEHACLGREAAIGAQDLLIRHLGEESARFVLGLHRQLPARGMADADGGGDCLRVGDRHARDQRRRAFGLDAVEHRPRRARPARVLAEAFPVRRDVAGVAHRQRQPVRNVAELFDHLEGGSLLPLEAEWVHAVHQRDGQLFRQRAHRPKRGVEVAPQHDDTCAVRQRLRELAQRHLALGHHHPAAHLRRRAIGGRAGGGVPGGSADGDLRARLASLGHRHHHPPVLEGAGGVHPLALEPQLVAANVARERGRRHQRRVAFSQ